MIASGRPASIQYEACKSAVTLGSAGWQPFTVDLTLQGDLMRGPFWVDGKTLPVRNAPPMTLGGDADDVLTDFGLRPEEIEDRSEAHV